MNNIDKNTPFAALSVEQATALIRQTVRNEIDSQVGVNLCASASIPEYYGIDKFCEVTGYSKHSAYKFVYNKEINHYKRGRKIIFSHDEVMVWLTGKRVVTRTEKAMCSDEALYNSKK